MCNSTDGETNVDNSNKKSFPTSIAEADRHRGFGDALATLRAMTDCPAEKLSGMRRIARRSSLAFDILVGAEQGVHKARTLR